VFATAAVQPTAGRRRHPSRARACKPNENAHAVILHYKAINEELEAQLAVALAQRDAWLASTREWIEAAIRLVTTRLLGLTFLVGWRPGPLGWSPCGR
jgi:hypothetical protein